MKNDGGSAFPKLGVDGGQKGMSLLDYFAAAALQGIVANAFQNAGAERYELKADFAARHAYCYATAMLKAREQRAGDTGSER